MGKILWGIVLIVGIFSWLGVSASKDVERNIKFGQCTNQYMDSGMQYEGRDSFIKECMN